MLICRLFFLVLLLSCSALAEEAAPKAHQFRSTEKILNSAIPGCSDDAWRSPNVVHLLSDVVGQAEKYSDTSPPRWNHLEYIEYSQNGSRLAGQKMIQQLIDPLAPLVLAECLEGSGRFIQAIERTLDTLSQQPSWTLPAHDINFLNLRGDYSVDLNACELAHDAAWALKLVGSRLNPDVRTRMVSALKTRVFMPLRKATDTRDRKNPLGRHWWIEAASNWNAVCISGVVGAAYALEIEDLDYWLAFGRKYSRYYLGSFKEDGYSDEGPSYWNYGFGAYLRLRETFLWSQPNGDDLLSDPMARLIATYPTLISFPSGTVAPFGDAPQQIRISEVLKAHAEVAVGLATIDYWKKLNDKISPKLRLNDAVWRLWGQPKAAPGLIQPLFKSACSVFPVAGVAVFRPSNADQCQNCLSVALRTGGSKRHAHDDAGSYAIDLNGIIVVGDPGAPVYTKDTFGPDRRKHPFISSYGHPVPYVDNTKQLDATIFQAKWIAPPCSQEIFGVSIDLLPVYEVSGLDFLRRDFHYDGKLGSSVRVTDSFASSRELNFETAILTRGIVVQGKDGLLIKQGGKIIAMNVISSHSYDLSFKALRDNLAECITRIALTFRNKSTDGFISYSFHVADELGTVTISDVCVN